MFNARCHLFLEARKFTLGQFMNPDQDIRKHSSIIFKLEGANPPGEQIKRQLESVLKKIIKRVHKAKSCNYRLTNFFFHEMEEWEYWKHIQFCYKVVISENQTPKL